MASGIWRLALVAVAAVALTTAGFLMSRHGTAPPPTLVVTTAVPARAAATRQPTPHPVTVYVSGAVGKPGVYTMPPGSRAVDAVATAGGALGDADLNRVNLAAPVNDGEQLAVPQQGEAQPTPDAVKAGGATRGPTPTPQGNWLLNVNNAAAGDFRALPGIGKVTADRLVAYRSQNGPYASVDDLLKAGMHKTELDRIRARLTVQ